MSKGNAREKAKVENIQNDKEKEIEIIKSIMLE